MDACLDRLVEVLDKKQTEKQSWKKLKQDETGQIIKTESPLGYKGKGLKKIEDGPYLGGTSIRYWM